MLKGLKRCLENPSYVFTALNRRGFFKWVPDSLYLKIVFKSRLGYSLNLKNPKTFNEKIQWQKLYGNLPRYTNLVDKYEVRKYVASTIGEEYLIPLLGVWDKFEDIDFSKLPNQFVLKCNHDCGSVIICTDKATFNVEEAKNKLTKFLKRNIYYPFREPQYKKIKPRIICEKYMVDESGTDLKDYKIFYFNGIPKIIQVHAGRFTDHKKNTYDMDWNYIPVSIGYATDSNMIIQRPGNLQEMLNLAQKLSENIPHVRVDLYSIRDKIYFGELTFTGGGGFQKFEPKEFDLKMGSWFELQKKKS